MNKEHAKLHLKIELVDLTQEQLEKYQEFLVTGGKNLQSAAAFNSLVIRAAITTGFLSGVELVSIPVMRPAAVTWITQEVLAHVKEQNEIPPN